MTICQGCRAVNFVRVKKSSPGWLAGSGEDMSEK